MSCLDTCAPGRGLHTVLCAASEGHGEALVGGFSGATLQKPGTEPKWNLVLPKGTWHGENFKRLGGSIDVTDDMVTEIVANWEAAGKPRLPIRWGHEHLSNTDAAKQALLDRKAGNLLELRAGAHGLEALTAWNELGAKDIDTGAFDAWSPEWYPTHTSRKSGETKGWWLSGVALTGDPYFHLMPPVAASAVADPTDPTPTKEHRVSLVRIAALFGLTATASEDAIIAAAEDQKKKIDALTATAPDFKSEIAAAVAAHVEPLKASLKTEQEARAKSEIEATGLKVDALIASAKAGDGKNGRAIVDEKVRPVLLKLIASEGKPEDGFKAAKEYLDGIPLTVPVTATGTPGSTAPLTAASANAKIAARADELRKAGDPTPTLSAMREMPTETLIAENRRPTPAS